MTKYLLNYANITCYKSQQNNRLTGLTIGNFDQCICAGVKDIDSTFYEKNKAILSQRKGAGFWLWKPYIILNQLKKMKDEDFLFYNDATINWVNPIDPLCDIAINHTPGILCFHINAGPYPDPKYPKEHYYECGQTKRDTYIVMDCDTEKYWYENYPVAATYIGFIKNKLSIQFVEEWLHYAQNINAITDAQNIYGENLKYFQDHRHDQSIYSILRKKYELPTFTQPCQWGNEYRHLGTIKTPYVLYSHRNRV